MRSKARITITLAHDLLEQVDQLIDEKRVRNRSHAIEMLVRQSLLPQVTSAAILAGGKYQRDLLPSLMEVGDSRLIHITIEHLVQFGIRHIYILAGPYEDQIREELVAIDLPEAIIDFVPEAEPRGTAGAVKLIEDRIGQEPLLVVHGDVLTDIDLADFIRFHKQEGALATIAVKPREAEQRYGKVMLQGNRITEFSDADNSQGISIVNTGVYLIQPEALRLVEQNSVAFFENDLFPHLAAIDELSAFIFQGIWFDISQPASYRVAKKRWANRER